MAPVKNRKDAPLLIQGYTVIQVKPSPRSSACHCLYLREHSSPVTRPEWPQGRTLLVHNVPPYCSEENVQHIFKSCGDIIRVYLQSKTSSKPIVQSQFAPEITEVGAKIAYVVFRKPGGLKNATSLVYDPERLLSNADTPIVSGLRGYIQQYKNSIVDEKALEKNCEEFMAEYNRRKDDDLKQEKEQEGVPDDDGFIKVTRHGKNKGVRRTEETQKKGHEHIRKRKEKNELKDFYVFQYRETKRKHIAELQAKFEEDKKKVKDMKAARKFRPY